MHVLFLGRAPRTKETLPDFLMWRRVTRPPLVFRGLTGSQRTPGFWGVTRGTLEVGGDNRGKDEVIGEGFGTDVGVFQRKCFELMKMLLILAEMKTSLELW